MGYLRELLSTIKQLNVMLKSINEDVIAIVYYGNIGIAQHLDSLIKCNR